MGDRHEETLPPPSAELQVCLLGKDANPNHHSALLGIELLQHLVLGPLAQAMLSIPCRPKREH